MIFAGNVCGGRGEEGGDLGVGLGVGVEKRGKVIKCERV